jgi:hypothetical protein
LLTVVAIEALMEELEGIESMRFIMRMVGAGYKYMKNCDYTY